MSQVLVVGAGIAGLTAAYTAVQAGHQVTVVEAAPEAGGAIAAASFHLPEGILQVDAGAEAYATRSAKVAELVAALGLTDQLVTPNPAGSWLYLPEIGAVPAPKLGMWGIPGDPTAPEVVAALGAKAAARAAQELTTPMDTWQQRRAAGQNITIGALVADRFGPAVVDRLVAPVVAGVHSADPYDMELDKIAPGLIDQAIRHGSVAKAVAHLRAAAPLGAAVKMLIGGMHRLITALVAHVGKHATIRYNTKVQRLEPASKTVATDQQERFTADRVVLAIDAPQAYDLLAQHTGLTERPTTGAGVALVTLVVDLPELDEHPRGTGMLVSPAVEQVYAKAATHITAKWQWAQQAAQTQAEHRHLIRLSYGRITDPTDGTAPAGYATDDAQLFAMATNDVARMFGLDQARVTQTLVGHKVVRWRNQMPLITKENTQRINAVASAAQTTDWIQPTGAWFAGTGLAAITAHTTALQF